MRLVLTCRQITEFPRRGGQARGAAPMSLACVGCWQTKSWLLAAEGGDAAAGSANRRRQAAVLRRCRPSRPCPAARPSAATTYNVGAAPPDGRDRLQSEANLAGLLAPLTRPIIAELSAPIAAGQRRSEALVSASSGRMQRPAQRRHFTRRAELASEPTHVNEEMSFLSNVTQYNNKSNNY